MTSTLKVHPVPCFDWCAAMQGALLQHTLNRLQPRFVGLRREKDRAERTATDLATQVSCLLINCYTIGLPLLLFGFSKGKPVPMMPNGVFLSLCPPVPCSNLQLCQNMSWFKQQLYAHAERPVFSCAGAKFAAELAGNARPA